MLGAVNIADLAEAVAVHPDDVRVVLGWLDDDDLDERDRTTAVHMILNPNRERTVPELYIPGVDQGWREV